MAEEETRATPVACAISVMLIGSIGFQMLMFYLVNCPDRDIRKYSWQVISQTISIFCAVMLFQGFNGMVEEYAIEGGSRMWEVFVDMTQLVVWLTALQIVLAVSSGSLSELIGGGEPEMDKVELNVKSWSVLFSHVAGFAAINAWGSLQQNVLPESPLSTLCVVPVGLVGLFCMYHGYDGIREYVAHMDDGTKDEFETLWDKEVEEAEHDVAGLSLSFLTVQSLRFKIGGVLPNQEGLEDWDQSTSHAGRQWQLLLIIGGMSFALSLLPLRLEGIIHEQIHHKSEAMKQNVKRIIEIVNNYFTFGTAWCFFYGVRWALSSLAFTSENALLSVVLALFLSAMAFSCIFTLDKMQDNELLGQDSEIADTAVEKMITALGILIGFSWEQSFDTAVGVVAAGAQDFCPAVVSKLLMSMLLVAIVFPAWRLYILKSERELLDDDTEEKILLKTAAAQHRELFLSKEVDEQALDLAHLKMKQHRRRAHNLPLSDYAPPGLTHLMVTADGITEIEPPAVAKRKKHTNHMQEITESLLA